MHRDGHPNQTHCPECNARLWIYPERLPDIRCVCGHVFTPEQYIEFVPASERKKAQDEPTPDFPVSRG